MSFVVPLVMLAIIGLYGYKAIKGFREARSKEDVNKATSAISKGVFLANVVTLISLIAKLFSRGFNVPAISSVILQAIVVAVAGKRHNNRVA